MVWPGRATISNNKCMLGPEDMEDNTKLVTMALTMEVILNSSNKEPTTWQLTSNNNSNLVTINNNNNNMEDILNSNSRFMEDDMSPMIMLLVLFSAGLLAPAGVIAPFVMGGGIAAAAPSAAG